MLIVCEMIETSIGLVAIFGPPSTIASTMVESISNNFEIPHVQINWSPKNLFTRTTVLNLYPDPILFGQGLAVIVKHMAWKNFAILYENNEGLLKLQEVLKLTINTRETILVRQLDIGNDYRFSHLVFFFFFIIHVIITF